MHSSRSYSPRRRRWPGSTAWEDRAYTLFAEAMDLSGYARETLAPRPGMSAPNPEMRPRPIRTTADMGMAEGAHEMKPSGKASAQEGAMAGMDHEAMRQGDARSETPSAKIFPIRRAGVACGRS